MKNSKIVLYVVLIGLVLIVAGWIYSIRYYSALEYQENFDVMNDAYKISLRAVENERQYSADSFRDYRKKWDDYYLEYVDNRPRPYKFYSNWTIDLEKISEILSRTEPHIITGDYKNAFSELNQVRLIWRNIYKSGNPISYRFYILDLYEPIIEVVQYAQQKNDYSVQDVCPVLLTKWRALKDKSVDMSNEDFLEYDDRVNELGTRIAGVCDLDINIGNLPRLGDNLKNTYDGLYLNFG